MPALRAAKPVPPTDLGQILAASSLSPKALLEIQDCLQVILDA